MSAVMVRRSIEALYQEAEAVVDDGTPMLAILKSFPAVEQTTLDAKHDATEGAQTVSLVIDSLRPKDSSSLAVTEESNEDALTKADQNTLRRIGDLMAEAENIKAETTTVDRAETDIVEIKSEKPSSRAALPDEPPAPSQAIDTTALNDFDLEQLLDRAKADADALATEEAVPTGDELAASEAPVNEREKDADDVSDDDHEDDEDVDDIDAVMADIAAAVGVVPTTPPKPKEPPQPALAPVTETITEPSEQHPVINTELAIFIGNTVRTVLNEELPTMVRVAVKDALDEMQPSQAKAQVKTKTKARSAPTKATTKPKVKAAKTKSKPS